MQRFQLAALVAITSLLGCSVINSFDDVKEAVDDASSGGSSGDGGTGASGGVAGGGSGGDGGAGASGGAGGDGGAGGSTGGTSGAAGADSGPVKPGLILVAGQVSAPIKHFVVAISPWTGEELARKETPQPPDAIAYEAKRDKWFLFFRNANGQRFDPAELKVGDYDETTGAFTELGSTSVPAPTSQGSVVVLNNRILYGSSIRQPSLTTGLTVIDTSKLDDLRTVGQPQSPLPPDGLNGMLGRPNSSTAVGGTATIVQQLLTGCIPDPAWPPDAGAAPELCPVKLLTATVTASLTPTLESPAVLVGYVPKAASGKVGWTIERGAGGGSDIIVFPPKDFASNPQGKVARLNPFTHLEPPGSAIPFNVAGPRISDATFDACRGIVLAVELNVARTIYAIPTAAGGVVATQLLAGAGQRVVYEPYTKTVIRPFDDNATPELSAWVLEGDNKTPSFKSRPAPGLPWAPPTDVIPKIVVVKDPPTAPCN